jgi:hypothetical protein
MAASVRARLKARAVRDGRPFNEVLQYYAIERFLYRVSRTPHAERVVLKGALMLQVWGGPLVRSTRDIDLLDRTPGSVDELVAMVRECLAVPVEDDGMVFDPALVEGQRIRLHAHYEGVQVLCRGRLGVAQVTVQVDVGFGDVVTPQPMRLSYGSLLDLPEPELLGTTPETMIAEKFEAMVVLDFPNSRMKDFYDLWFLGRERGFDGEVLAKAIEQTFKRRRTPLPTGTPIALTAAFANDPTKQTQWRAFVRKVRLPEPVPTFEQAVEAVAALVLPPVEALVAGQAFERTWEPGGPWR